MGSVIDVVQAPRGVPELKHFTLNGEKFFCRGELPGTMLLENEAMLYGGNRGIAAKAIIDFFSEAMSGVTHPEPEPVEVEEGKKPLYLDEYQRFRAYVDDPARRIQLSTLGEIYAALLQAYIQRPTKRPSVSTDGPQTTETSSTGSSSSQASG